MNMKRLAILLGISAQLGCLVHAKPDDKLEIRKKWKTGDDLLVWSKGNKTWCNGEITKVDGDKLTVQYRLPHAVPPNDILYTKEVPRYMPSLLPNPIVNRNANTQSVQAQTEEHPGNVRISTNTNILKPQTAHSSAANHSTGKQVIKPLGKTANTKPKLTRAVSPKPKPASKVVSQTEKKVAEDYPKSTQRAVSPKSEEKTEELPQLVNPLAAPPVHVPVQCHVSKGPLKRTLSLDSSGYALTPRQSEEFYYKQLKPHTLALIDHVRKELRITKKLMQNHVEKLEHLKKEKTVAEETLASVSARRMDAQKELKNIDKNIDIYMKLTGTCIASNTKKAATKKQQELASRRRELKIRYDANNRQLAPIEEEFYAIQKELHTAATKPQLAAIQEKMLQNRKAFDTNKNESATISAEIMKLNAEDCGNDEKLRNADLQAAKLKTQFPEALDKLIKQRTEVMKKINTLTQEEVRAIKDVEENVVRIFDEKKAALLAKINEHQQKIDDLAGDKEGNKKKSSLKYLTEELAKIESALAAELK